MLPHRYKNKQSIIMKNKKAKISSSPISEELYSERSTDELRKRLGTSGPYTHLVIDDLCTDSRMRAIHEEVKNNMVTDFKETDLFKVYQTGELANLNIADTKLAKKIPELLSLRTALYSDKFREFVSKVTGVNDLTARCDCSINAYVQGCHLLCHDDVIGTRRVSYIIYITDPDEEWKSEDGGALELFPLDEDSKVDRGPELGGVHGIPTTSPTKNILPHFNRMAMFTVQPGRSYHSVQEVFADKPRISISGWFHGPDKPKGADQASLSQVMGKGHHDSPFISVKSGEEMTMDDSTGKVSEEGEGAMREKETQSEMESFTLAEKALLGEWINPVYLTDTCMDDIKEHFCSNDSVQLKDFLRSDKAEEIRASTCAVDKQDGIGRGKCPPSYSVGTAKAGAGKCAGWEAIGPPHKRRYLVFDPACGQEWSEKDQRGSDATMAAGGLLDRCRHELMESPAFAKLLRRLTTLEPIGSRNEVRRFRPGLDYTVAHFGVMTKDPRLDATLCFVDTSMASTGKGSTFPQQSKLDSDDGGEDEEDEEDEEDAPDPYTDEWASGDCGGFECYIETDHRDNGEAAESYRRAEEGQGIGENGEKEDDSTLLSVTPGYNVLSLVMRDLEVMKFVKYVSAAAPGSRWDVTAEYAVIADEDEGGEDDDDDNDEVPQLKSLEE